MHEQSGTVIKICGGLVGFHGPSKLATAKRSYFGKPSQITTAFITRIPSPDHNWTAGLALRI